LFFALTASVLGIGLAFDALDVGDKVASIVSCLVGVITLALTWATSRPRSHVDDETEASALGTLAERVTEQVRHEATVRGLLFPEPLRVPWSSVNGPTAAAPDVVLGRLPGARRTALRLRGDVTTLAGTLEALPHQQVVILGEEGSGKTSTALLLALRLLDAGRIPLIVDLAEWDPDLHNLDDHLVSHLSAVLPAELSTAATRVVTSRLVERGKLVPVLDGLDDMSPSRRKLVINEVRTWDRPFVLTSKPQEYEKAVRAAGVTVARALIVRLAPLPAAEIITHLTAGSADAERRWGRVTSRLREPGPLHDALASPLMSSLARTAYSRSESDPDELLSLSTADAVERHLVDAAYRQDESLAWLARFAHYLTHHKSRHLDVSGPLTPASWGKYRRTALSLAVALGVCLLAAKSGQLLDWNGSRADMMAGGVMWAVVLLVFTTLRLASRRVDVATPFRFRIKLRRVLGGAAGAVIMALLLSFSLVLSPESTLQLDQRGAIGLLGLIVLFAALSVFGWHSLTEPLDDGQVTHPLAALHSDGLALLAHFPLPLVYTTLYCATLGQWSEFYGTLALSILGSTGVTRQVPGLAWSRWCLRSVLLHRRIPTSDHTLGSALEEARERGILRAAGTRYRFQHTKIHDQLAGCVTDEDLIKTAQQ
jgi:hypothetical protein